MIGNIPLKDKPIRPSPNRIVYLANRKKLKSSK